MTVVLMGFRFVGCLLPQFRSLLCVWSWDGVAQNTMFSAVCRFVSERKNPRQSLRERPEPRITTITVVPKDPAFSSRFIDLNLHSHNHEAWLKAIILRRVEHSVPQQLTPPLLFCDRICPWWVRSYTVVFAQCKYVKRNSFSRKPLTSERSMRVLQDFRETLVDT